jgi:hypothetical protein
MCVGFEVFTAVTMKNAVFWDVAPCRSCELNRRFGGTSVQFTSSTRRHVPEDGILQIYYERLRGSSGQSRFDYLEFSLYKSVKLTEAVPTFE